MNELGDKWYRFRHSRFLEEFLLFVAGWWQAMVVLWSTLQQRYCNDKRLQAALELTARLEQELSTYQAWLNHDIDSLGTPEEAEKRIYALRLENYDLCNLSIDLGFRVTDQEQELNAAKTLTLAVREFAYQGLENLSEQLHNVYQEEARRQDMIRHPSSYGELSEPTKELDRVLARWIQGRLRSMLDNV